MHARISRLALLTSAWLAATGCTAVFPFEAPLPARLQDGFEHDTGLWSFTARLDWATATRTGQARTGVGALCAQASEPRVPIYATAGFGIVGRGDLWLRGYWNLPSDAEPGRSAVLAKLMDSSGDDGIQIELLEGETMQVLLYTSGAYVGVGAPNAPLRRDHWECLELHIDLAETDGTVELFHNGARVATEVALDTMPTSGFDQLAVGLSPGDGTNGTPRAYVDDVVVATERWPCD